MSGWNVGSDVFDVVLIGDPAGEMAEAVALAGGRVVARHATDASFATDGALVAVELTGLGETPPDLLADLAARADIVACTLDQLDPVAAALLWTDAQLLRDPTPADRVAALAWAAAQTGAPEPSVREGDTERLRRFGGEVARIAQTLARLAGEAGAGTGGGEVADHHATFHPDPGSSRDARADAAAIRQAIRARRLRTGFFGDGLFEDPAWDMLLDLYAAELEGGRVSVSSLCIAAHVAPTTALRWIGRLADARLFRRLPDPHDRRRAFIALTPQGSAAMRGYLTALERAGMVLG